MVNEYSSGPLVALEVEGEDAVFRVRAIAGPRDVDVAQRIRPDTLRAKYGISASTPGAGRAKLAIHTTDLPGDGATECEELFALLD
jgi:nucleoside diphosphate kinase